MPLTLVHIEEREIILYSRWQPLLLLPLDVPAIEERGGESFFEPFEERKRESEWH